MNRSLSFTVVVTPVEGEWVQASLAELPGVVTCARTEAEARKDLLDALREYLASFAVPGGSAAGAGQVTVTIGAA